MLERLKKNLTVASILAALIFSQQALAHAHLASATPADKATISESPKTVILTFTEGIEPKFSSVMVMTTDGSMVNIGKISVDNADNKVLNIPLTTPLKAGTYRVDWNVLSVDGHKTKGNYSFTLK